MPIPPSHTLIQQAYSTGSPALALELASRFLREYPDHPPVLLVIAEAATDLARFDDARAAYAGLERVLGPSVALANSRGSLEETAGDLAAAAMWFERAAAMAPTDARPCIRLSALAARQGDLSTALTQAAKATTCTEGPLDEAWLNHGLVLRSVGRYREAQASFDHALALTPDYPEARRLRADVIAAGDVTG